jgi:putative hydrolase of the HAD superfamily
VGYLKPHPLIFQTALRCVGTQPDETVFVGDDPEADIVGAHKAGLRAVLRRQTRRKVSLDSITPDAEINGLDELLPILDQWYPGWRD